eukprot:6416647-Pyramimonas_sp.AAC.1
MVASFSRTKEYKAAGAAWMLDPICSDIDDVTVGLLEGAMGAWSEEARPLSSKHALSRRLPPLRLVYPRHGGRRHRPAA